MEQTDLELLRLAQAGRTEAFHQLVDRHAAPLFRVATTFVRTSQDAEDVLQETFTAAFKSLRSFQERSSVKTWLYAILFRQAALLRRKNRMPLSPLAEEISAPEGPGGEATPASVDARLDVQAALARLPEYHRAILTLREFDGLSYEEIAAILAIPRGTVESRIYRARQALKQWLGAHNPSGEPS